MTSLMQQGRACALVAVTIPALLAPVALGQDEAELAAPPPVPKRKTSEFHITPNVEYQFGGDDIETVLMAGISFDYAVDLSPDVSLQLGGGYRYEDYDFETVGRFDDPWDTIHNIMLKAYLNFRLNSDLSVFGGPVFLQAYEDGPEFDIDFDENSLFGGTLGVSYRVDETLLLGGGVTVIDQYQDNPRVFPLLIVDWEITSDLRLSSRRPASEGQPGVELIFDYDRNKEIAIGIGYRYTRFRLDDDGLAPDGVGQVKGMPMWGRFTYSFTPTASLSLYAGIIVNGRIDLEFDGGASDDTDRDTSGMVGLTGRFTF